MHKTQSNRLTEIIENLGLRLRPVQESTDSKTMCAARGTGRSTQPYINLLSTLTLAAAHHSMDRPSAT